MSTKELVVSLKQQIADLTKEKKDAVKLCDEKDAKIKLILIKLEQCNTEVHTMGKKISELETKLKKKQQIKRVIDEKITEILENTSENKEKKDASSVDKGGAEVLKEFYEK